MPVLTESPPSPIRLLLIDDNHHDAHIVERSLRRHHPGHVYQYFSSPEAGLEFLLTAAENDLPDLLLLDIKMPRMTGLELLAELETAGHLPLPFSVIVFSTSTLPTDVEAALRFTDVTYQTKPNGYLETRSWLGGLLDQMGTAV